MANAAVAVMAQAAESEGKGGGGGPTQDLPLAEGSAGGREMGCVEQEGSKEEANEQEERGKQAHRERRAVEKEGGEGGRAERENGGRGGGRGLASSSRTILSKALASRTPGWSLERVCMDRHMGRPGPSFVLRRCCWAGDSDS